MFLKRKCKKLVNEIKSQADFFFVNGLVEKYPEAEIYLVGGLVRDYIMGRRREEMVDYDFVVRNVTAEELRTFLEPLGWVDLVGRDFGVYKFVPRDSSLSEAIDIALPRTDFATGGGGYHDFAVQTDPALSLREDLSRRDFTMNAMAINMQNGSLVDPFDGLRDIRKKNIITVGAPKQRFREDYSRILRAIRFAVQLDCEIDPKTWQSICRLGKMLVRTRETTTGKVLIVPRETLSDEFMKSLKADPLRTLDYYDESGILRYLFPEIEDMKGVEQHPEFHSEGDVYVHTRLVVKNLPDDASQELRLAALLHDVGKPPAQKTPEKDGTEHIRFDGHDDEGAIIARQICKRIRLSNKLTERVVWLIKNHMLFVAGQVEDMRAATIKKYFIDDEKLGDNLLELYRIDILSAEGKEQDKLLTRQREVVRYVENMREAFAEAEVKTFRHVISGQRIMEAFDLQPGPEVGKHLRQADDFIFKYVVENKREPEPDEVIKYLKDKNLDTL